LRFGVGAEEVEAAFDHSLLLTEDGFNDGLCNLEGAIGVLKESEGAGLLIQKTGVSFRRDKCFTTNIMKGSGERRK
jgi:hypothetical protein